MFTVDEIDRYGRQILLPEWGAAGQERLAAATVAIRGDGAAAQAAILYLAGAGVGTIAASAFTDEARALNPNVTVNANANANVDGNGNGFEIAGPNFLIAGDGDRFAAGAAAAVETIKALLGLPHLPSVSLP